MDMDTDSDTVASVIQGSGIGPLLFLMFINELAETLRSFEVTVKLCADDLKIYLTLIKSIDIHTLQDAIDHLVRHVAIANIDYQMFCYDCW